jgi:hypothetical protein
MDLAQFVGTARVIKDTLGRGGFTGIDMCCDADISHPLEWDRSSHKIRLNLKSFDSHG